MAENGARWAARVADAQLPKTVRSVIQARLNRLNEIDLRILRVAAVIGHEFGHGVLRQAVESDVSLTASLDTLRTSGHIHQISILPEATYRFHHVLVQEVVRDSLLQHQRRALHKGVGEAIEALSADAVDQHAERLTLHFQSAGNWAKTVRYARIATDKSWAMSQFSEALAMLEIAEHAARRTSQTDQSEEVLVYALLKQERVCETLGRRDRQEELVAELVSLLEPGGQSARLADVYVRQGDLHTLRGRFDAAETALQKALDTSRAVSATDLESRVLRSMGFLFYQRDQPQQALALAEEVIARDRQHEGPRVLLHDLLSLSTLLKSLGEHGRALKAAQEAAELVETHNLRDELANTSYLIAEILKEKGELSQALAYLQEALDHSPYRHERSLGSARKPGLILVAIANIHSAQGNLEECLKHSQDAVGWGRKSKVSDDLAGALRTLGVTLLAMNRYGEALPHFREAQSLYSRMEDLESEAAMQQAAARCTEQQGNLSEAISDMEGVLALRRRRQDRLGELEALESLGRLTHEEGRPTGVPLRFYREALALADVLRNGNRKSHLHNAIGILKWKRGEYESALAHYQEALRVCEDLNDVIHAGLMLNSIGATLHKLGRLAEARATLEAALEQHRKNKNLVLEGYALAALGDILYDQEKYELSIQLYEKSPEIRRRLKDRKGEAWMLHHLARARNASGQEDKARWLLEQASAIAIHDDITQLNESCLLLAGSWESSRALDESASL